MKKRQVIFVMLFSAIILLLSSCTKDELGGFVGNYSFKTGGYVTFAPVMGEKTDVITALQSESGQMDIISDGGDGKVLITMNILKGIAVVINATVSDSIMTLEPFTRYASFTSGQDQSVNAMVTVSGTARKVDNMIVFDLTYQGVANINGAMYSILSSSIEQFAKEN